MQTNKLIMTKMYISLCRRY